MICPGIQSAALFPCKIVSKLVSLYLDMKISNSHIAVISFSVLVCLSFVNLDSPDNYSAQGKPAYIQKDNTPATNPITNKGATLGRVLFYDKQLSANNSLACAGCHLQQFAFGDTAALSKGHLGGLTTRHAMRLVNARFGVEQKFFWNERANSLEDQTTHPLKDAVEMGWSGTGGQGNIDSLIKKMNSISYYKKLFPLIFGDSVITESKIQFALAQFIRSIQSFDSKFDQGLAQTNNIAVAFPNFSPQENQGKALFLAPPNAGGAGCQGCHAAPEFDIDPNTNNNGVIAVAGSSTAIDLLNTRAPSLRNIFNSSGQLNGPLMHNANFKTIAAVINHYNAVPQNPQNTNLDVRLQGPGSNLNLNQNQKDALAAFLQTLSGSAVYNDPKWSDPFDGTGLLTIIAGINENKDNQNLEFSIHPSLVNEALYVSLPNEGRYRVRVISLQGEVVLTQELSGTTQLDLSSIEAGSYFVEVLDTGTQLYAAKRIVHL